MNRNGVLDANEKSSTGGTTPNFGLLEYTTVYSREPNFHSDGTSLTNVNTFHVGSGNEFIFPKPPESAAEAVATAVYRSFIAGNPPAHRRILAKALLIFACAA